MESSSRDTEDVESGFDDTVSATVVLSRVGTSRSAQRTAFPWRFLSGHILQVTHTAVAINCRAFPHIVECMSRSRLFASQRSRDSWPRGDGGRARSQWSKRLLLIRQNDL